MARTWSFCQPGSILWRGCSNGGCACLCISLERHGTVSESHPIYSIFGSLNNKWLLQSLLLQEKDEEACEATTYDKDLQWSLIE